MVSFRRSLWYLFVLLGILVFGGALAVVLAPGLGEALPIEAAIDALGSDYLVVAGLGVVALGVLVVMLVARAASSVDEAAPPEPEYVERVPVLGAEFDDLVENGLGLRATYFSEEPERVRDELREQAIRTLIRKRALAREDARSLVESGRWTDDETASQFLAADGVAPRSARVRAAVRGESWLQYGARAAADEIVALAREDVSTSNGREPSAAGRPDQADDRRDGPGPTGTAGGTS
ncbi:DUF7269 family protein [Halomarina oriensis]|uniref:Uncharacterized protein n=1 Tax=Halomarina oriensis TaxID=671145 RepID=A0A6B0GES6_9EURY|nr:hypothetical protein [Halomarina oriensis]MWG33224.1 hypothetical protein [Halomarina oriensis]